MTTLDRFESIFRAALKDTFVHEPWTPTHLLVVTDLKELPSQTFAQQVMASVPFLKGLSLTVTILDGDSYKDAESLLEQINTHAPDLICTYRNLYSRTKRWPYSLGSYLDVMAQVTPMPVLVMPHPTDAGGFDPPCPIVRDVLVLTDHMTGASNLINHAASFVGKDSALVLAHIEDESTFERYAEVIGKLPNIDTDQAVEAIRTRLLKEASDFVESCRQGLAQAPIGRVVEEVRMGHLVNAFKSLIQDHEVELVVFNVKDEDQLAMHGLAYPLAVELRSLPILMV